MASNLTDQVRSISEVTKAVALGDLSRTVNVDVQGEMLDLKMTVNQMVAQLSTLANEVTRVSLEVGTEGILGGQAYVPDVQGMWKVRRAPSPTLTRFVLFCFLGVIADRARSRAPGAGGQRELDGDEPDEPGALDRRGDQGRRERGPDEEDRGGRARGDA